MSPFSHTTSFTIPVFRKLQILFEFLVSMCSLWCCMTALYLLAFRNHSHFAGMLLVIFLFSFTSKYVFFGADAGVVGANYGMLGNDLPPPNMVVALLKSRNIAKVRLFNPNHDALDALKGSGIEVILGTLNEDLQELGNNPSFAESWVQTNVLPYSETVEFRCIAAGNEVIPSDLAVYVFPAMKNLDAAIKSAKLANNIPVSTSVSMAILGTSNPPSEGEFSNDSSTIMGSITAFLAENKYPLLVNVYPYFAYIYDQSNIPLAYALFNSSEVVVWDGQLGYKNLFDAITDAVYSALEKSADAGASVDIVVTESGWPSNGNGEIATILNAEMYNNNMVAHVSGGSGSPKRPGKSIEAYVFAIFNENLKPVGTEQNFGLYYPNMTQVYHVNFTN